MKNNLEDEIKDWLENGTLPKHDNYNDGDIRETARHFAEWADKTMINKACEWLQNHTMKELCMNKEDSVLVHEFIESFKKAMMEE